jgi:hypothetical protein
MADCYVVAANFHLHCCHHGLDTANLLNLVSLGADS